MWHVRESNIHGIGIFASEEIAAGVRVALVAKYVSIGELEITIFGNLVNHQTIGNCELRKEDRSYWAYTLANVSKGSELVSDYRKAPSPFTWSEEAIRKSLIEIKSNN